MVGGPRCCIFNWSWRNKALVTELSTPRLGSRDLRFPTQYAQSFLSQFVACIWKQRASYWWNPSYTAVRFLFTTFIALMFGIMFWDLGTKRRTRQDLFSAMGSMYTVILFIGIQNASSVQPVVAVERTVFDRERAAGMYSFMAYAIAQKMPIWWRWYYWACPIAWTLYGLLASQFGEVQDVLVDANVSVEEFLQTYFRFLKKMSR